MRGSPTSIPFTARTRLSIAAKDHFLHICDHGENHFHTALEACPPPNSGDRKWWLEGLPHIDIWSWRNSMDVSRSLWQIIRWKSCIGVCPQLILVFHASFTGPSKSIEETQQHLVKSHLPISEHGGDIREYRASYAVYIRSPTDADDTESHVRDPSLFIGRVGIKECGEYGPPFSEDLTIPKDILEKSKILKLEVGYAFLSKAWGKGYATEAMKGFVEAVVKARNFWSPSFERIYLHAITGEANTRSTRVLGKVGFKLNGMHRWEGPDVFIGGAMQPPEVCVFSLGPLVCSQSGFQSSEDS